MPRTRGDPLSGSDEYEFLKELGIGEYSQVVLAMYKPSGQLVRTGAVRLCTGACMVRFLKMSDRSVCSHITFIVFMYNQLFSMYAGGPGEPGHGAKISAKRPCEAYAYIELCCTAVLQLVCSTVLYCDAQASRLPFSFC